jgi:hypothetical protein
LAHLLQHLGEPLHKWLSVLESQKQEELLPSLLDLEYVHQLVLKQADLGFCATLVQIASPSLII